MRPSVAPPPEVGSDHPGSDHPGSDHPGSDPKWSDPKWSDPEVPEAYARESSHVCHYRRHLWQPRRALRVLHCVLRASATDARAHGEVAGATGDEDGDCDVPVLLSRVVRAALDSPGPLAATAASGARRPNSLRIVSSTGSMLPACFVRMTKSQSGSNFFQPAAYAAWRSPDVRLWCAAAPRAMEVHR